MKKKTVIMVYNRENGSSTAHIGLYISKRYKRVRGLRFMLVNTVQTITAFEGVLAYAAVEII